MRNNSYYELQTLFADYSSKNVLFLFNILIYVNRLNLDVEWSLCCSLYCFLNMPSYG